MSQSRFLVRRTAVLGAGVMGAQIAAHLANAGVPALLFDLAAKEGDPNAIALKAIENLKKLEPAPLAAKDRAAGVTPANYDQHLPLLAECDLVIEAISERMDWKQSLYERVAPHVGAQAIFATNTSGLSINALAEACPAAFRPRFCGVHFFNPPRYMHLVELIAQRATEASLVDQLETFLVTVLGKGIVRAKDTPNFVANRVGVFSLLATMVHTDRFGLGFDVVDALTGPAIGRARSATYRTSDVVGLDTLAHVIRTMHEALPDDPWHRYYQPPAWLQALLDKGALGQKTKAGFYQKVGKDIQVLDPACARVSTGARRDRSGRRRHPGPEDTRRAVRAAARTPAPPGAVSVEHLPRPVSLLRVSPGRDCGQRARCRSGDSLGLRLEAGAIRDVAGCRLAAGGRLGRRRHRRRQSARHSRRSRPGSLAGRRPRGVHTAAGAYAPASNTFQPRSPLPVYARQYFPDPVLGETLSAGTTILETDARAAMAHRRRHRRRFVQDQAAHD